MLSARDLAVRWPSLDVAGRRERLLHTLRFTPGALADSFASGAARAQHAAAGLWHRDPSVWSGDADVQKKIANRLGWLASPALMADSLDRLQRFAADVRRDGISHVVLLGMGGSSLAPEVFHRVLGVAPGWPRFQMLDSTDPEAVRSASTPPDRTLYLLSSKSGTTIEPNVLAAHFRRALEDAGVARPAQHFVAITDEGTELARRARSDGFRDLFINPGDIGGRYSALSFFGMVPAALMGLNVSAIVAWGLAMLAAAESASPADDPAVGLGQAIGTAARAGRDKLTLLLPPALEPFGLWVEQLIAESTGKQGRGVVPIAGERLGEAREYGDDRLFVRLRIHGSYAEEMRDTDVRDLVAVNAPLVEVELPEPSALGAECVRWEIATAVAGALLEINPFDEPNVQQAKDATNVLLAQFKNDGRLQLGAADQQTPDGCALTLTAAARRDLAGRAAEAVLTLIHPGDYLAVLAYLPHNPQIEDDVARLRHEVRQRTHAASMFGYGPRYLHSTGQLHKGGPNSGVFLVMTATPRADLGIPGEPFTFGTLELAQALGDFSSLDATGRRALHVHLPAPDRALVRAVFDRLLGRI